MSDAHPEAAGVGISVDFGDLKKNREFLMQWSTMCTIVTTTGMQRLGVTWYDFFAETIKYIQPDVNLPLYRTVRGRLYPFLIKACFPKSSIVHLHTSKNMLPSQCIPDGGPSDSIQRKPSPSLRYRDTVGIILPSDWANLDVVTSLPLYGDLTSVRDPSDGPDIYDAPILKMRQIIDDLSRQLQVDDGTGYGRAWHGDLIAFDVRGLPSTLGNIKLESAGWHVSSDPHNQAQSIINGTLGPIWTLSADPPSHDILKQVLGSQNYQNFTAAEEHMMIFLVSVHCKARVRAAGTARNNSRGLTAGRSRRNDTVQYDVAFLAEPGDVCAFLRPKNAWSSSMKSNIECVYLCHYRLGVSSPDKERLVWITNTNTNY